MTWDTCVDGLRKHTTFVFSLLYLFYFQDLIHQDSLEAFGGVFHFS